MLITSQLRMRLLVQNGIFVALLIVLVALLAFFAQRYRVERDLTQNARHTISQQSRDVLAKLSGPLKVTVFALRQDVRGDVRRQIQDFFAPYQRIKSDLSVSFIDPREEPKLTQAAGARINGEAILEYDQRSEHLTDYDEQSFANALMRMMRSSERIIMGLEGHGERRLHGVANHDLGEFGKQLGAKGFKLNALNLALAQEVPANTNVLVIASPQVDLQATEVEKIKQYLGNGGNLLWLIDPEPLHGLQPIAERLSLVLSPGMVWDPSASKLANTQPTVAIAGHGNYGRHPTTDNLRLNTIFPFARQLGVNDSSEWRATRLIEVAQRGWVETGNFDNHFDKSRDIPGPVNIALALERPVNDRTQRVIVVGSGSFLANTFLGNGGNLDLGVNLVNWLAGDELLITIQPRPTLDSAIELGVGAQYFILFGFLILLPLLFIGAGTLTWWRRRKA